MTTQNQPADQAAALASAETALSRIQRHADAAREESITASEAVEQILDELEGGPALDRIRRALGRSLAPPRPH